MLHLSITLHIHPNKICRPKAILGQVQHWNFCYAWHKTRIACHVASSKVSGVYTKSLNVNINIYIIFWSYVQCQSEIADKMQNQIKQYPKHIVVLQPYIHYLFIDNAYNGCLFVSRDSNIQITSFSMNLFLLYATLVTVIPMNTTAEYDTHRESN